MKFRIGLLTLALFAGCSPEPATAPIPIKPGQRHLYGSVQEIATAPTLFAVNRTVSILDTGAIPNDATDDAAAIQSAVAKVQAAGGGIVYAPPGTYRVGSTIRISAPMVKFVGAGLGTTFVKTQATADLFYAAPTSAPSNADSNGLDGIEFSGFRVVGLSTTTVDTGGAAIHIKWARNPKVKDVKIGEFPGTQGAGVGPKPIIRDGVYFDICGTPYCGSSEVYPSRYGITYTGSGQVSGFSVPLGPSQYPQYGYNGIIEDCTIYNQYTPGSAGIYLGGGTGGVAINHCDIGLWETSIRVDKAITTETNRELFVGHATFCDSAGNYGLHVAPNSLNLLHWSDVWCAGDGRETGFTSGYPYGVGIFVEGPTNTNFKAVLAGGRLYANTGSGVVAGGGAWNITGLQIHDGGTGSNGGDGIHFSGGSAMDDCLVTGNTITGNGNSTRGYGVRLSSGMLYPYVHNNAYRGNPQGTVSTDATNQPAN